MEDIVLDFSKVDKDKKLADLFKEYEETFRTIPNNTKVLTLHIDKEDLYVALLTRISAMCVNPAMYLSSDHFARSIMQFLETHTIEEAGKALEAGIRFTDINLS